MAEDAKPIDDATRDTMSVAPGKPGENENDHIHHPRQDAGQDESIARRLERDPENKEAQLDTALDESMDASDPPASTQPAHDKEPPASSGYNPEAEERLRANRAD